ncbi:hypothetical protein GH5_04555 [Leishmania sp. Ghana 2012 LV757]|uniref:hypothetical protein n=1 Tax=Leishmania sp. Ghana 2012 LV757 TaxID=2803181 RepID=UPI001B4EB935|nr:hypothetical protein GH5_04555 [Leishmania sp. Ghana 2012 LV757]
MQRSSCLNRPSSSRLSVGGAGSVPSEADLNRLRSRLKQSGAIISSRSVASRADANFDVEVVNVGEGRRATPVEHLLARLEQHGLRRRLVAEDDAAAYAVDIAASADTGEETDNNSDEATASVKSDTDGFRAASPSSSSVGASSSPAPSQAAETREPHYYLCVPCELRLTRFSHRPPRWRVLEDVHFHFSSASHRATASWMADEDIDETLHTTPLVTPTHYYSRIYVNGIPTLLSRRPGGGDMFYPLPHEQDLVAPFTTAAARDRDRRGSRDGSQAVSHSSVALGEHAQRLFPPSALRGAQGGAPALWHRALPSLYTGVVQIVRRTRSSTLAEAPSDRRKYRVARTRSRILVGVDHCSCDEYREQSWMPQHKVPLSPALYRLHRERVPKPLLARPEYVGQQGQDASFQCSDAAARAAQAADVAYRTVYTQPYQPIAEGSHDYKRQGNAFTAAAPVPMTVFEDECYRVALVSAAEQVHYQDLLHPETSRQPSRPLCPTDSESQEMSHPVLTLERLMQHTQSTSKSWRPAAGSVTVLNSSFVPTTAPSLLSRRSSSSHLTRGRRSGCTSTSSACEDSTTSRSSPHRSKRVKREGGS